MKQIIIKRVPDDLHKAFKIKCATNRITQREAILNMIKSSIYIAGSSEAIEMSSKTK